MVSISTGTVVNKLDLCCCEYHCQCRLVDELTKLRLCDEIHCSLINLFFNTVSLAWALEGKLNFN